MQSKSPSVLLINPNSNKGMTDTLEKVIKDFDVNHIKFDFFTAPGGPYSIDDESDAEESCKYCTPELTNEKLGKYDGFIVACYSKHPLVEWLQDQHVVKRDGKEVNGIFQASVTKSLDVLGSKHTFGVVTTSKAWERDLTDAVLKMSDVIPQDRFAGVKSTGLTAGELHELPVDEVASKMKDATKALLKSGDMRAVCLGCAGMIGMDAVVGEACIEALGHDDGKKVEIVDGVLAAVRIMESRLNS
ncbi:MAG: hypothetical protein M1831_007009 [Alyxoria varia]|nr:MAG: hypothetical protein M1831_007009 [Alyxoria varia]